MFSAAFSPKPDRVRSRAVVVGLLIGLATTGLTLAPQVASAAARTYSATISPRVAQVGTTATFTVTFTDTSSAAEIKKLTVKLPTGFKITGVGAPSHASWTVSRSGKKVTLSGLLRPGHSVSIPITAIAPTATGLYKVVTTASGRSGTFTRAGSDPSVTVAQNAAVVVCNANLPCVSPTLSAGASPMAPATDAQVTAQSGPQADQLTVVLPDPTAAPLLCQQSNGTFGQIVTWAVTTRTSTLVYTIHAPNSLYTYDLSDTCFGSTQPFPGAVQNPANGNEFEGTLPFCTVETEGGPVTSPPPCVESIVTNQPGHGNDAETVTVTVDAPQGDPKFTG